MKVTDEMVEKIRETLADHGVPVGFYAMQTALAAVHVSATSGSRFPKSTTMKVRSNPLTEAIESNFKFQNGSHLRKS